MFSEHVHSEGGGKTCFYVYLATLIPGSAACNEHDHYHVQTDYSSFRPLLLVLLLHAEKRQVTENSLLLYVIFCNC